MEKAAAVSSAPKLRSGAQNCKLAFSVRSYPFPSIYHLPAASVSSFYPQFLPIGYERVKQAKESCSERFGKREKREGQSSVR